MRTVFSLIAVLVLLATTPALAGPSRIVIAVEDTGSDLFSDPPGHANVGAGDLTQEILDAFADGSIDRVRYVRAGVAYADAVLDERECGTAITKVLNDFSISRRATSITLIKGRICTARAKGAKTWLVRIKEAN